MEDYPALRFSSSPSLSASPSPKSNPSTSVVQNPQASSCSAPHPETKEPKSPGNASVADLLPPIRSLRHSSKHLMGIYSPEPISPFGGFSDYGSSGFGQDSDGESGKRVLNGPDAASERSDDSLPSSLKPRSWDVYVGLHGCKPSLLRFANWLRSELELQGVSCFVADRSRCRNSWGHYLVESAMNAASFGVVIIKRKSFSNPYTIEELRLFSSQKNLVPIFFGLRPADCSERNIVEKRGELWEKHGGELWLSYGGSEKGWKEAVDGLSRVNEWKLVAHAGNWRDCISEAVFLLGMRLGRRDVIERVKRWKERVGKEEFLFPRNSNFVGRKKELIELELILFGNVEGDGEKECFKLKTSRGRKSSVVVGRVEEQQKDSTHKGKEPVIWRESEEEIEMEGTDRELGPYWRPTGKKKRSKNALYGKGIACVSGDSGVGKTELLLELAYRFSQRYRMVLWIGGESRYIRQNYMSLLPFLGVDVTVENEHCPEKKGPRSFKEQEEDAIRRVRKELMRDIPFLIVIDNLEAERDWWDARNVMDLLPRFGGETHVIISTRLPRILNMEPMRLSCLSSRQAMSLMTGSLGDLAIEEVNALKSIEDKLGRMTFGLALVGAILSELPISPSKLLNTITRTPHRDLKWSGREDSILRHNPFLVQLLDVCLSIFSLADGSQNLATRMVLVSGWFAPSPIPVSLLTSAAYEFMEDHHDTQLWKKCVNAVICACKISHIRSLEAEASAMLVRFRIARNAKQDSMYFHDIVQIYARKRGSARAARAMVQVISNHGSLFQHVDHMWAACFLLFKFEDDQMLVELKISDLLSFIKRLVLPLANLTFTTFSRCVAAKELLNVCSEGLDVAEKSFVARVDKSMCWICAVRSTMQLNPTLYRDLMLVKATLLETRAELMLKGGEYEIGEEFCKMAIGIRSVACGEEHPETVAVGKTLEKLMRLKEKKQRI